MLRFTLLSFGSPGGEDLYLNDKRLVRHEVSARSPLTVSNIGREGRRKKLGRDFSLPNGKGFTQGPVRMGNGRAFTQADEPPTLLFARIL